MPWLYDKDGQSLSTGKIPIDKLEEIAQAEGTTWVAVMETNPAVNIGRLRAVVGAIADVLGVPSPADQVRDGDDLLRVGGFGDEEGAWFTELPAKSEQPFMDGNPPTPAAPDGGSSPGVSGGSTGSPTTSDDSDQTTS